MKAPHIGLYSIRTPSQVTPAVIRVQGVTGVAGNGSMGSSL